MYKCIICDKNYVMLGTEGERNIVYAIEVEFVPHKKRLL